MTESETIEKPKTQNNLEVDSDEKGGQELQRILKKLISSDTILLALLSGISYVCVYTFNLGYFFVFDIPSKFLSLDLIEVFGFASLILLIFVIFGEIVLILIMRDPNILLLNKSDLFEEVGFILLALFFAIAMDLYWGNWILLLFLFCLISITIAYIYWFEKRKKRDRKDENNRIIIRQNFSKLVFFTILVGSAIMLTMLPFILGMRQAKKQVSFYTIMANPECVVLYFKGETVICSPFDRTSQEVERVYKLVSLSNNSMYELKEEYVGPLKLKDLATPTSIPTITATPTATPIPTLTATSTVVP